MGTGPSSGVSPAIEASSVDELTAQIGQLSATHVEKLKTALAANDMTMQLADIARIKKSHPNNLAMKHFDLGYYNSLDFAGKQDLLRIVKSGSDNADSGMGCYACNPKEYDDYKKFFEPVLKDYHKIPGALLHVTNWDLSTPAIAAKLPPGGVLDLSKLGLGNTSMRVRVGRNLEKFPLPGAMTRGDRVAMEDNMIGAFKQLMADPKFGGVYSSLTPGSAYFINAAQYQQLIKDHVMFKDMAVDPYLASAGIAGDWPYGRGAYQSADKEFIIWVGEEDHLRIMVMKKGTNLNDVFNRLKDACGIVEQHAGKFAHSMQFGYVTSCPTNLGTGMRASLHLALPNLTKDGTDTKAKAILKPFGLSVRGLGGEHTPIGADGTVDLSPSARLMIQEAEIVCALYEGIKKVLEEEKKA